MVRLGLGFGAGAPRGRWWPEGALFAADFARGLYMRNGLSISAAEAFTFTRASTKLAIGRSGAWTSFAANVPCIAQKGLLLEPERSNTVLYSSGLENRGFERAAVTPNGRLGIDGTLSADLLTATSSNVNGAFAGTGAQTIVPGSPYSFSMILERATSDWIALVVTTSDFAHRQTAWFNLATATAGLTNVAGTEITLMSSPQIEALSTGQVRVAMTISTATATAPFFRLYLCNANGAMAVSSGASVWAAHIQVEAGASASSVIASYDSVQTRAAETCFLQFPAGTNRLMIENFGSSPSEQDASAGAFSFTANNPEWIRRIWVD